MYEDLFQDGPPEEIFKDVSVIYIGYKKNSTSSMANFVFPVRTVFERTGTFVNRDHILQKFFKAVNPPRKNIWECWAVLSLIMNTCSQSQKPNYAKIEEIWESLPGFAEIFDGIDFNNIPLDGILLKKN